MKIDLSGKNILITGGTSRLGQSFVEDALNAGAKVYFTHYRSAEIFEKLEKQGAKGYALDLLSEESIATFLELFKKDCSELDVLIHNAAAIRDGRLEKMSEEDWDDVMNVNVKGPYFLTKKLLRMLFKRKPSKVFALTSRTAFNGAYGAANYAASKAALVGLMKSLAKEIGKKQVLVNLVNPGFMISKMTENLSDIIYEKQKGLSPLGAFSDPTEVSKFLVYLCSDKMKQVTGQTFHFESREIV